MLTFHEKINNVSIVFRAYDYLEMAAELGHNDASAMIAEAYLLGTHRQQNMTKAKELLDILATKGSPHGQRVSVSLPSFSWGSPLQWSVHVCVIPVLGLPIGSVHCRFCPRNIGYVPFGSALLLGMSHLVLPSCWVCPIWFCPPVGYAPFDSALLLGMPHLVLPSCWVCPIWFCPPVGYAPFGSALLLGMPHLVLPTCWICPHLLACQI